MLLDVLNNELDTLTIDVVGFIDLDEDMASGVGCVKSSCSGTCGGVGPPGQ